METVRWLRGACAAALAVGLCGSLVGAAHAQSGATAVEPVIVTGTRLPKGLDPASPNVTTITAQQIAAGQPSSAAELLRWVPDVFVQQAGGRGSITSIFTRGAKPNFTLVLVDGVEINDSTNSRGGSYDFSSLSLDDIDHVEVVRGPASAIYGSGAVGGVINFVTTAPSAQPHADADLQAGGFGYLSADVHASGGLNGLKTSAGVEYLDNGEPVDGNAFRGTTVDGSVALAPTSSFTLAIDGRESVSHARSFPDSSGGPLFAVLRDVDRRDIDEGVLGLRAADQLSDAWSVSFEDSLYQRNSTATSPGVAGSAQDPSGIPANSDDVNYTRNRASLVAQFGDASWLSAALGADVQVEQGADDGTLDFGGFVLPTRYALKRTDEGEFVELRATPPGGFDFSASERVDELGPAGSHSDPNAAIGYRWAPTGTRVEVSWGQGYKLPSFYALGNPIVGDPTLRPEAATNLEFGLSQPLPARSLLKLDWYDTRYTDLIDFVSGPVPKLVNRSQVVVQGAEASIQTRPAASLTVEAHVSYTHAHDQATNAGLLDVPLWLAGGQVTWRPNDRATVNLVVEHVGALLDNAIPTGNETLPGHQRVDLSASWTLTRTAALTFAIENLLNSRYQEVIGFPAPGAVARVGLKLAL